MVNINGNINANGDINITEKTTIYNDIDVRNFDPNLTTQQYVNIDILIDKLKNEVVKNTKNETIIQKILQQIKQISEKVAIGLAAQYAFKHLII